MKRRIAVVGAGVSGLTCAVALAEAGWPTKILAEAFGAATTSAAAAAIWFPYDVEPAAAAIAWSLQSYDDLRALSDLTGSGVSMIELRSFARAGQIEIPSWAAKLDAQFLTASAIPNCFTSGFALRVPLTDTTLYLDYLAARFEAAGGEIETKLHFDRLEQLSREFDLIVNCAGIGARELVPDPDLKPHRGQVVLVPKFPLDHAIVCDDPPLMYVIPRAHDCVFGGTNEVSEDRAPDSSATAHILTECSRVLGINPPEILGQTVGLRPFRAAGICLRAVRLLDGRTVIHNYGHGGAGFTLSWGCAAEVVALARNHAGA